MRKIWNKWTDAWQSVWIREQPVIEIEVNGCPVILHFASKAEDHVMENIQSVLSNAYDERIQKELKELIGTESF